MRVYCRTKSDREGHSHIISDDYYCREICTEPQCDGRIYVR